MQTRACCCARFAADYSGYRPVDGVQVAHRWTLARPNGIFTIRIKDVRQNVPIEDSRRTFVVCPPTAIRAAFQQIQTLAAA